MFLPSSNASLLRHGEGSQSALSKRSRYAHRFAAIEAGYFFSHVVRASCPLPGRGQPRGGRTPVAKRMGHGSRCCYCCSTICGDSCSTWPSNEGAQPKAPAPAAATSKTAIAVLPFTNLSADKEQEYFSDGLTEELLNVLAKNPKLQVTSRTSAFSFKGTKSTSRQSPKSST